MKVIIAFFYLAAIALGTVRLAAQTIPDQIEAILARPAVSNNTWTILIENESGSVNYYEKNPTTGRTPASNTKIFTTAAAFGLLGTNHFFETRIYTNGAFSGGVLTGDLNLVSEHDMTWNTSVFSGNARRALEFIVGKLKASGLTSVVGNVQCFGVCIYNYGSTSDTRDTANQATYNAEAAAAFKAALIAQGITVSGGAFGQTGWNPPGNLFYTHKSTDLTYGGKPLRLDVASIPLMKVSHNAMADLLLRHIGYKLSGIDSFAAGRNKVLPWLTTVGVNTSGIVMNDGSGYSSGNRFSAHQTLTLVRYMSGAFPSWNTTLPIGCVDGTIGSRFCGTDGSGTVRAKTGSLSVAIALSGYIINKYDNRRYYFSFMGNRSGIDQAATRDAIDDCVVLIGGRGEPLSPQLVSVTNVGNGTSLNIAWSDEKFVRTGYRLYSSADGITFNAPILLGPTTHSYTENGLVPGQKRYYRVSVVGAGGESQPSRVYGAQVSSGKSRVLVVDGNDRWQVDLTDNPSASSHRFSAIVGQNISGPAFDTVNHNAVVKGTIALTNYPAVVWLLGEESTDDETFSSVEQTLVTAYLNSGGNLFLSGAEIGWDLDRASGPTVADRNFYHNQLRSFVLTAADDDANTYSVLPVTNGIFSGNPPTSFDNGTRGTYNVAFPDVLTTTNNSVASILYSGGRGGAAAVVYDGAQGGGKLVHFGFPFETITNSAARDAYMSDVLRFFEVLDPVKILPAQFTGNSMVLNWTSSAGIKYRVQFKTDLNSGTWIDLLPDITATNTTSSVVQSTSEEQTFYRVRLVD